ncbi:ABC transporter ATP-binding protein [Castellaniella sp.]|uniref:ABC transporter ATP-binding protein n=1 Tax=Castellaniella sp. TaxID=1955812 RepID=UPI003561F69C
MNLLEVRNLSKSYGGFRAVSNVSFDVCEGELLALIGPNGAGKTTTFNMINGQLRPSSGSITLMGTRVEHWGPRRIARLGVSRTFQIAETFSSMLVVENVQMALLAYHREIYSFFRKAAAQYRRQAMDLLQQVGMAEQAERPCSELAYGDVKRVELAMALANEPRLLLMDEPTAGMAPKERNELMALTKDLVVQRKLGVLFTEHSMDVVFAYSDRMIVLARGELVAEGDVDTIRNHPGVREVYFGGTLEQGPAA